MVILINMFALRMHQFTTEYTVFTYGDRYHRGPDFFHFLGFLYIMRDIFGGSETPNKAFRRFRVFLLDMSANN